MPPRRQQAGFTILEAIVALVVFASGALALYSLYSVNIDALLRSGEVTRQVPLVSRAAERLAALNLVGEASGEFAIEGVRFVWSAKPIAPPREGQSSLGLLGSHRLQLFELTFTASEQGRLLGEYRIRLAGHQLVRPPELG